jgi:hypothetical protein
MVDFSEYSEVKPGEKMEAKIIEVNEGKQEDFRTDRYFENIDGSKEEIEKIRKSPALQVVCDNQAEMVINLPAHKKISPRSKLALFKKTYNDFPKVGMKVNTKTDDSGFFRIVIESS